jgi:hypothetical protein
LGLTGSPAERDGLRVVVTPWGENLLMSVVRGS